MRPQNSQRLPAPCGDGGVAMATAAVVFTLMWLCAALAAAA